MMRARGRGATRAHGLSPLAMVTAFALVEFTVQCQRVKALRAQHIEAWRCSGVMLAACAFNARTRPSRPSPTKRLQP